MIYPNGIRVFLFINLVNACTSVNLHVIRAEKRLKELLQKSYEEIIKIYLQVEVTII